MRLKPKWSKGRALLYADDLWEATEAVVSHYWDDERKDFAASSESERTKHIFRSLDVLRSVLAARALDLHTGCTFGANGQRGRALESRKVPR